jgi:hypothetical protein
MMKHLKKQPLTDDQLRTAYEKTALHRMGIPLELALERVSWLRSVLEGGSVRRRQPQPMPAADAGRPSRQAHSKGVTCTG